MIDTKWRLFDGREGEDAVQVWLEPRGAGVTLRTQEWGAGIERNFGWDTIETYLEIDERELSVLAYALVAEHPELDSTMGPIDLLAAAYRGDSAASGTLRRRLDSLGLPYRFTMR